MAMKPTKINDDLLTGQSLAVRLPTSDSNAGTSPTTMRGEMTDSASQSAVDCWSASGRRIAMAAGKSRRAILACAVLAIRTLILTAPAPVVASPIHALGKHTACSRAQLRQGDFTSGQRAAEGHKRARDPFASMLLG
jgi:hypothetical protein